MHFYCIASHFYFIALHFYLIALHYVAYLCIYFPFIASHCIAFPHVASRFLAFTFPAFDFLAWHLIALHLFATWALTNGLDPEPGSWTESREALETPSAGCKLLVAGLLPFRAHLTDLSRVEAALT